MGFANSAYIPKIEGVLLKAIYYSDSTLHSGVETHSIKGVPIKVFNIPKTIVDCFKYRNKVGFDIAIEALKEGFREKKFTMDEIRKYAKQNQVTKIMKPYFKCWSEIFFYKSKVLLEICKK
jgi:predicted transcriptional regulator of viral defense system